MKIDGYSLGIELKTLNYKIDIKYVTPFVFWKFIGINKNTSNQNK